MRKCPKCGGTEFTCTQVQKHRVILDGSGKFILNDGCITEDPVTGPYVCRGCGTEYRSLEELAEEPEYTCFTFSNGINNGEYAFKGRPVIEQNMADTIRDFAESRTLPCGYYLFTATSVDGGTSRSGAIRVSKDPLGNRKVDLAEEWKEYVTLSMPAAKFKLNAMPVENGDGIVKDLYVIRADEEYIFRAYPKARIKDNATDSGLKIEIETVDPFITYECTISAKTYNDIIVRYKCCDPDSYEPHARILYSAQEMLDTYLQSVDKREYQDYDCWQADMLNSGVFKVI